MLRSILTTSKRATTISSCQAFLITNDSPLRVLRLTSSLAQRYYSAQTADETREKRKEINSKIRFLLQNDDVPMPPSGKYNGWTLFVKQQIAAAREKGHTISVAEEAKNASNKWKALSEQERQAYKDRSTAQREKQKKVYDEWLASLTPTQYDRVNQLRSLRRKKGERVRSLRDPSKPKRALTPYMLYLQEQRSKDSQSKSDIVGFVKTYSAKWNSLSEAEKAPYVKKYEERYDKYADEIRSYEEKLVKRLNLSAGIKKEARAKSAKKTTKKKATKKVATKKAATKKVAKKVAKKPAKKQGSKTIKKKASKRTPAKKAATGKTTTKKATTKKTAAKKATTAKKASTRKA